MQFLKILFWCLLAFIAAVFTLGNWTTVPLKLWGGLIAEVNLPLLLLATFLLGFLPMLLIHYTVRWRLRQRLANAQRAISDLRACRPSVSPAAGMSESEGAVPPGSIATAMPPGGA